ncbi:lysine--tRNA ligase [Candidatus Woesearchaeota archaeon]|nr:lysine--tRNA ligase [Candidatus Woesearchaeota archaeon]
MAGKDNSDTTNDDNALIKERKRKVDEIRSKGIDPYPYSYEASHRAAEILERYKGLDKEQKTEDMVSIAGRMVSLRGMGKVTFSHIQDITGRIQLFFRQDDLGKESYKLLKLYDIGDFVGVRGNVFTTKTGEISIHVKEFSLLSKALRPLPEKYHGIKDSELRYRKRYLDLIMDSEARERFMIRTKVIALVREYLNKLDFIEVETPVLQVMYGGTNAKPFTTHINTYNMPMYLRVAPELYLKRLVVGGFERVYEIAKNFRNEGVDQTHNPEFTMIEWYEAYCDYNKMMDRAEAMYKFIAKRLFSEEKIKVNDRTIDLSKRWPRLTLADSLKRYAGIDAEKLDESALKKIVDENRIEIRGEPNRGQMLFALFDKLVCEKLIDPVWIIDYPKEVSPLAKTHRKDDTLVERFECYIGGKEIGDGWSEIIDPADQRSRFETEQKKMRSGDSEAHPMDEDFLEAMEYGMPPLGGIGIGIDRLVMLFTNHWSIRDVMFFPIMKPEN